MVCSTHLPQKQIAQKQSSKEQSSKEQSSQEQISKARAMSAGLFLSLAWFAAMIMIGALPAQAQAPAAQAPAAVPALPRTPEGRPDFTGIYIPGGTLPSGATELVFGGRDNDFGAFEEDNALVRMQDRNKPVYWPKYWKQVRDNDYNGNWREPGYFCKPDGVPRLGAPSQIVQTKDYVILLYNGGFWGKNSVRFIPINRPHIQARVVAETFLGDPVATFEGETLVIETIGFTDESWLHKSGYMHGFDMKVTERLTRQGNNLRWVATVEDPEYLQEPWVMNPVVRQLNTNPDAFVPEDLPCNQEITAGDSDVKHLKSRTRSG